MSFHRTFINRRPISAVLFGLIFSSVFLFSSHLFAADTLTEKDLSASITQSMGKLISKLKLNRAEYRNNADLYYQDLNAELSQVIDFKRIALKVMGKHGRRASIEEREQFIQVFKQSLYKSYASVLLQPV